MPKTPIEMMLDGLVWVPIPFSTDAQTDSEIPFATHSGVLNFGECSLRVYQLNTGQRVVDTEDFERLFAGALSDETATTETKT